MKSDKKWLRLWLENGDSTNLSDHVTSWGCG